MAWIENELKNFDSFLTMASGAAKIRPSFLSDWFFRGQACASWGLKPKFARAVTTEFTGPSVMAIEDEMLAEFRRVCQPFLNGIQVPTGDERTNWWSVMQHFGCPTRLLDWTESIAVAAYFACIQHPKEDAAIWAFRARPLQLYNITKHGNLRDAVLKDKTLDKIGEMVVAFKSEVGFGRLVAQRGAFTVAGSPVIDHAVLIERAMLESEPKSFGKMIIPASEKLDFLHRLDMMNVNAAVLFPGLDGLGAYMAERLMRLETLFSTGGAEGRGAE